jgi:hypothetical protein
VSFVETCNVPCYKIASFEHTFIPLLKRVAATGKPVIISCGLASIEEISETVDTVRAAGAQDLCLLCCTSSYPASIEDSRAEQARAMLDEHGLTFNDRFDAPHARPEIAIERDARTGFARLIRELDLDCDTPAELRRAPGLRSNRRP